MESRRKLNHWGLKLLYLSAKALFSYFLNLIKYIINFKKTLKYISKRIYLIFQNQKVRNSLDDIEQIEKTLNDLVKRINAFSKLFKPTSDYLRKFEVIGIIGLIVGIFLNTYIMTNIDFYLFSLLLLSLITFILMLYFYYLILHHKINSDIMKSEINKKIEYYLDYLTFFYNPK